MESKYEGDAEKQGLVSPKVWKKASRNGFYCIWDWRAAGFTTNLRPTLMEHNSER